MNTFKKLEDILNFAIEREEEAHLFYDDLAKRITKPELRQAIENFAIDEVGHKIRLKAIKEGRVTLVEDEVGSLGILDDGPVEIRPDMDYSKVLLIAMKKEKNAFRLYSNLAAKVEDEELKNIFNLLAQEEAEHKLRFEIEYDLATF